jgi:FkbM family methyltransferase
VLGESRFFKMARGANLALRKKPALARFVYRAWDGVWSVFLTARSRVKGDAARFNLAGKSVRFDLRDRTVTRALYLFGQYEPRETKALLGLLRPGMTFVDIGANTGYYAVLAAKSVGERGKVVAFEPCPDNADILRRNAAINKLRNMIVVNAAVTAARGDVTLRLCEINAGDHRIYDGGDDDFFNAGMPRKTTTVPGFSLDNYMLLHGLEPDVIKMDIQGAEHIALQGMKSVLCKNRDVVMMVEYWPHGLRQCGSPPKDLIKELRRLGFRTHYPSPEGGLERISLAEINELATGLEAITLLFSRNGHLV